MPWKQVFLLCLCCTWLLPPQALAAPPFKMAHPETQEEGVWIPVYIQRYHLQVDKDLGICQSERTNILAQRDSAKEALESEKKRSLNLEEAVLIIEDGLAQSELKHRSLEVQLQRRTRWATVSTVSAAMVALIFVAYAAAKR